DGAQREITLRFVERRNLAGQGDAHTVHARLDHVFDLALQRLHINSSGGVERHRQDREDSTHKLPHQGTSGTRSADLTPATRAEPQYSPRLWAAVERHS